MKAITFTRRFIAILLVLCNLPVGYVHAQSLNPPPPPDANCSTNPNGTVCHFAYARAGTNLPTDIVCNGFTINITFSAAGHTERTYDASGNITQEMRHVGFTGTQANSTNPAKTVPYEGHFVRTLDFQANTLTFTGLSTKVILPGGPVVRNVGRVVFDLSLVEGEDEVFVAGHWDTFLGAPMNTQPLCAALS